MESALGLWKLITPELRVLVLTKRHVGSGNEIAITIACFMAHALNTFYCRGALRTRVNRDIIGCVWTDEFDLNTLRENGEIFESGK